MLISFRKSNRCNIALCWTQRKSQPFKVIKMFDTPPQNPGVSKLLRWPLARSLALAWRARRLPSAKWLIPCKCWRPTGVKIVWFWAMKLQWEVTWRLRAITIITVTLLAVKPMGARPNRCRIRAWMSLACQRQQQTQGRTSKLRRVWACLPGACRPGIGSPGCHRHRRLWDCQDRNTRDPTRTRQGRFRPVTCQQVSVCQAGCPRSQGQ